VSIVFLLIPLGMVLVVAAAIALLWAIDSGQYDGDVEANGRIALELDQTRKLD
jgi:cbb3-type cytochrome oxidase maturation protein